MYSLFEGYFYLNKDGERRDILQIGSSYGIEDPVSGERMEVGSMFTESFPLKDFHGDVVYLEPLFDYLSVFEAPITIPIK